MDNQSLSEKLAAVAVALLLILTAWGNAVVMLVVAAIGLVVSVILFRKRIARGGALSAALGFVLAIAIALIMLPR
jgi:hypothetical protein